MNYIFQKPYLFKRSVYENIVYPLRLRKIEANQEEKRILNIIEKLAIRELSKERADQLLSGESQKMALARGLVLNQFFYF